MKLKRMLYSVVLIIIIQTSLTVFTSQLSLYTMYTGVNMHVLLTCADLVVFDHTVPLLLFPQSRVSSV